MQSTNSHHTQVHLTPAAGTTTTITTGDDGTVTVVTTATDGRPAAVQAPIKFPPDVEDMISRHEKNGFKGTRSREMAQELASRGWEVKAGPSYLRYIHPGENKVTLYANSRDLMSKEYRDTFDDWPKAIPKKNEVRWLYNEDNYAAALETIERLEAFAKGD